MVALAVDMDNNHKVSPSIFPTQPNTPLTISLLASRGQHCSACYFSIESPDKMYLEYELNSTEITATLGSNNLYLVAK